MPVTHTPVLVEETLAATVVNTGGSYLDATFGTGGHTRAILQQLDDDARVLAMDRDPEAVDCARELAEEDSRVTHAKGCFSDIKQVAQDHDFPQFDGILMDLGVSSAQLANSDRGFSFQSDGPLDMRMDPSAGMTAAEWLNTASFVELVSVFKRYGEERNARPIARAIANARPVQSTSQLVDVIQGGSRTVDRRKHVATRIFQAVRIRINDEINELRKGLRSAFELMAMNSRLAVITFHSLEHREVRRQFTEWTTKSVPHRMPVRGTNEGPLKTVVKGKRASRTEIESNIRARSAMLQVVERVR
ncbi:MAG: 16S rRNA (cytosine(1402)-N(4))-methyltransferase RsmH [Gammaproteobacteria bacterium]|nr:16S rRNA (cytosine(1402)-N(4))-methyltransferase RsmH [Gammaproteobacteria bacterium]